MKEAAPDLGSITMDLLFNPGNNSLHTRTEVLSTSDIAQGGFKICKVRGQFGSFCISFFRRALASSSDIKKSGLKDHTNISPFAFQMGLLIFVRSFTQSYIP